MIKDFLIKTNLIKIVNSNKSLIKEGNKEALLASVILDYELNNKDIFLVMPNLYEAQLAYEEIMSLTDSDNVLFFPQDEILAVEMLEVSGDFKFERINTIYSMLESNKKHIIVLNLNGAIKKLFNKDKYINSTIELKLNNDYDIKELEKKLTYMGYKSTYQVLKTGEFSRRGSILDIYPLNSDTPYRFDFFSDTIDTIKAFDVETQKSTEKKECVKILPVTEFIYTDSELHEAILNINQFKIDNGIKDLELEKLDNNILNLTLRNSTDAMSRFMSFFSSDLETILDYKEEKRVYVYGIGEIRSDYNKTEEELINYARSINSLNLYKIKSYKDLSYLEDISNILCEGLLTVEDKGINLNIKKTSDYKGLPEGITKDFKSFIKDNKTIICFINNDLRLDMFKELLLNSNILYSVSNDLNNIKKGLVNIIKGSYLTSFIIDDIIILNEKSLFYVKHDIRKPKFKSIYKNTTKVKSYNELKIGDYVVHYDYGIGKYLGLKTLNNSGHLKDYLGIEYLKSTLYAPLEQISKIEKYNGQSENVKLTDISTKQWEKAKDKVRKRLKDITDDLIEIYSKRAQSTGFSALPDTTDQVLFEADFNYELTKDQAKAIIDTKRDMESSKVMDRLICGDVGYGKTEVALRAAFKAIQSYKQVALLAPTTILSRQHYLTFKERMDKFGVNVKLLNRHVKPSIQKEVIEGLKKGSVDMVIGTHRLLSDEIEYKDLGLLIVDEEQRFGVMHKEKIKKIKANVDCITLSATPIPRTLEQSMVGIKDLSMIETPPKNRYPVQTYVLERNDHIIRDAILKELSRSGQVFYLYNFVEGIEGIASHLMSLVPEARICIAHGKMGSDEVENIVTDFIDKKYDVIVCTTIIETGIDIPDANTLIIHDANRLGLSQLYQLRGRVGRSDRIAYAYMMYEPHLKLTESAVKRLETIKEFNELGSGFKIAMRDLAIRGAGDLLGSEQSGFIDSVGIEMYMQILSEELNPKKVEEITFVDPSLNEQLVDRTISPKYIESEDIRIEIHKKIDKIKNLNSVLELSNELHDRFGDYDYRIELYMYEKCFKVYSSMLDICRVRNDSDSMELYISKDMSNNINGNMIFNLKLESFDMIDLKYKNHMITFEIIKKDYKNDMYLKVLVEFMDALINKMDPNIFNKENKDSNLK